MNAPPAEPPLSVRLPPPVKLTAMMLEAPLPNRPIDELKLELPPPVSVVSPVTLKLSVPWLVLVALTARPGAFRDFYRSPGGVLTLLVAGVLTAVGVIALGRLAREPVEVRPFATEDRA